MLTFDIIASCGFGIDADSINNPNDLVLKNLNSLLEGQLSVKVLLARMSRFSLFGLLFYFFFKVLFPKLMLRLFKTGIIEHIPKKAIEFFVELVEITIQRRRLKEQVIRELLNYNLN